MPEDFQHFYREYSRPVFFFLLRSVRDEAAAQDLLQEVFLSYYRAYYQPGRPVENPRALLFQMARYAAARHVRTAPQQGDSAQLDLDQIQSNRESPDETARARETQELMDGLLAELPEGLRTVILLRYSQELTFSEIGAIMGVTETAILRQVRKGEQALLQICRRRGIRAEDYLS